MFCLLSLLELAAQQKHVVAISAGTAAYQGEIGPPKEVPSPIPTDADLRNLRWSFGAFYRYHATRSFSFRAAFTYARLTASDNNYPDEAETFTRNLSFRNDILDLALLFQYSHHFTTVDLNSRPAFYVYSGVSFFYNNPMAQLADGGGYVALRPLETEGPENAYGPIQASIPIGISFEFQRGKPRRRGQQSRQALTQLNRYGIYFCMHIALTDYVDDISTNYPNPDVLASDEARAFSNRTFEVVNTEQAMTPNGNGRPISTSFREGGIRGNPNNNDYFFTAGIYYKFSPRKKAA